jgi:hypothetical protein
LLIPFAGPASDDFCRGASFSITEHFVEAYKTHTGRWASVGFLVPTILQRVQLFSTLQYAGLLILLWGGYLGVFYLVARRAMSRSVPRGVGLRAALLIGAVWWAGLPAPSQTVYWFSGGFEYGFGFQLACATLALALFHISAPDGGRRPALGLPMLAIMTFIVTGFHEVVALCLAMVLVAAALVALLQRSQNRVFLLVLAAVAVAGLLVSVLAPGNAVRAARHGGSISLAQIGYALYLEWYTHIAPWITDTRLLLASLIVLFSSNILDVETRQKEWLARHWWLLPLGTAAVVTACLVLPALVLGQPGPGRLQNLAYSVFIVGWFMSLLAAAQRWPLALLQASAAVRGVVGVLFALALLFTGNMQAASGAFAGGSAVSWYRWWHSLPAQAAAARGEDARRLVLAHVPGGPSIYVAGFQRVPDPDPGNFINRCMADYLGLQEVVVLSSAAARKP